MRATRWLDRTQPQTLYIATILLYMNAVLGLLDGFVGYLFPVGLVFTFGTVAAGWGIANEKKIAYWLGVTLTVLTVLLNLVSWRSLSIINLIFEVALAALLLHPQSREYKRIWFK